jgi:hypothetical protein
MLKFSMQTFYQSLFSIFPSTILFPSAIFPFSNSLPFQKLLPNIQRQKASQSKKPKAKQKVQKPEVKSQKAKAPLPPSGVFYSSTRRYKEGCDIITGETSIPASLNTI